MSNWRCVLARLLTVLGLALATVAGAAELNEGVDFQQINPPLAADNNKIEVTDFFWYRCPHCFDFEPILVEWARKLPADVSLRRVPAIFPNNKWAPDARLYYTLDAMNLLEKMHAEVFNAIHLDRRRLEDEKHLFEWVATKGIDSRKFSEAWSSAAVLSRVRQAQELTRAAGLTGVPAVMVHGRYLALTPGNYGDLVTNIDRLIERVRAEGAKK